jgi:fused-like protein
MKPSMPLLVELLKDQDQETVVYAAGALVNLAKYSKELLKDLIEHKALEKLLDTVKSDQVTSFNLLKNALRSISILCEYEECRKIFEEM